MNRFFELLAGRIDGCVMELKVPDQAPMFADILNFFCGMEPYKWIGHSSHHRVVIMTDQIRIRLKQLEQIYASDNPQISNTLKFFEDIETGVPFFFLRVAPSLPVDEALMRVAFEILSKSYVEECFSEISYGEEAQKVYIGHKRYSERCCRFCGRKHPDAKFKDENAHAIPQALGNNLLFCYDECMKCNGDMNKDFENDFIVYLDIRRTEAGIKGKKKIPTVNGHNYELKGETKELSVSRYAILKETDDKYFLKLEGAAEINHLNLYRALLKFAVNFADEEMLPQFRPAVEWLRGEFIPSQVPDVWYVYRDENDAVVQPRIRLFRRKDGLSFKSGPYCMAELNVIDLTFIFVIPFAPADSGRFLDNKQVEPYIIRFLQTDEKPVLDMGKIDMSDRELKFAHVKQWIDKTGVTIVRHERFERLQEKPHDLIDFPEIDTDSLIVRNIWISPPSAYHDRDLTYETAKISCSQEEYVIDSRSFGLRGELKLGRFSDGSCVTIGYSAVCSSAHPGEIIGMAVTPKGEKVIEFNGKAVLEAIVRIVGRIKKYYAARFPSFDFARLPELIMEHSNIIINPNPDAEQSVMPHG